MQWKGRRASTNVRDTRSRSGRGRGAGGILFFIASRFGIKGIVVLCVILGALWIAGINPMTLLEGGASRAPTSATARADEDELIGFVEVVLADTERIWHEQFERRGATYREPALEIYRGQVRTGCGTGNASLGPFYCPADQTIYIDLSFYHELERTFRAPGDFAQAYVIAHEVGHHVQNLMGESGRVQSRRGRSDYNEQSVRLELQADYYAGVWAHHNRRYLEAGDIEEAMRAAHAIGDDAIQRRTRGEVLPHAFTHGTSEQRMRWFMKGFKNGTIEGGDTFSMPYSQL